jgi:hypothetical protein
VKEETYIGDGVYASFHEDAGEVELYTIREGAEKHYLVFDKAMCLYLQRFFKQTILKEENETQH